MLVRSILNAADVTKNVTALRSFSTSRISFDVAFFDVSRFSFDVAFFDVALYLKQKLFDVSRFMPSGALSELCEKEDILIAFLTGTISAPLGCFSKLWTSEMSRTLQTSTVYFSRVSYLFEFNANDTYVLRMTHLVSFSKNRGPHKGGARYRPPSSL